jgi:ABC-type glycerol-3-phosphate transport system substrate-binding protein
MFRFHNSWVPMLRSHLDNVPASVMDAQTYQETFYPVVVRDLQSGANLVGIPLMYDGLALYINTDMLTAGGKVPPTTWDEFQKTAIDLTKLDEAGKISQAGAAMGRTDNVDHWEDILALMMLQDDVDLANPTDESAENTLTFFTNFATTHKVWNSTLPPSTQAFASGKLAMYFGPSWRAFEIESLNPGLNYRVVSVPQLAKVSPSDPDITWASYWVEGVWGKSQTSAEAWKFLKFLSDRSSLEKIYQQAAKSRTFGPAYPRVDMAVLLESDPVLGAYVKQAPSAKSWYLASRTFDGPTGINTRIAAYFEDAVNAVVGQSKLPKDVLPTVASGVSQVLSNYGR